MNESLDYLERRVEPQLKWHNDKSAWNKRRYYCVEVTTLLAGAAIPIVLLWAADDAYLARVIAAILGGVVVLAGGLGKLFKFQENWLQYRTLVENLERETELFIGGASDYADVAAEDRERRFIERAEGLLGGTVSQFVATHRAAEGTAAEPNS